MTLSLPTKTLLLRLIRWPMTTLVRVQHWLRSTIFLIQLSEGSFTYIDDATGLPVVVSAADELSPAEAASLLFTPVDDFNGVVTTVAYTVTDVNGETSDANIDITVTPTPDAVDDVYSGNEDTPVALDPLSNDDLGAGADTCSDSEHS